MKPIYKHIIASVCALIVVGYLVFGLYMSNYQRPPQTCGHLCVQIHDQLERQYVSENELRQLVLTKGFNPVGKEQSRIALQSIEDIVRQHPMIRTAECYRTMQGDVRINITQRVPLVRIVTASETYFIDTDRKVMPVRESVKTPVLIVTGTVNKRMAKNEISDFAEWLQQSKYWKPRVARAEVYNLRKVQLIQRNDAATILLGDWQGAERKLGKMQHWYEAGKSLDLAQYPLVDLRFNGQVIGIKKSGTEE